MPALPADIAAALRPQLLAFSQDDTIHARFPGARDGSTKPSEGFFDSLADAQAATDQRKALIGTVRRRFTASIGEVLSIPPGTVPTHHLIDAEQGLNAAAMVTRIEIDLEAEKTEAEYFG